MSGDRRSAAHTARDRYRHPIETQQFFGLKPDTTVIELQPGSGGYTEILAAFLHADGQLPEATDPKFADTLTATPAAFGHVGKIFPLDPPTQLLPGANNSAGRVLSFRNPHDWLMGSPETLAGVLRSVFDVLKPGGVFGFEEYRAKPFATATLKRGGTPPLSRGLPDQAGAEDGLPRGRRLQNQR